MKFKKSVVISSLVLMMVLWTTACNVNIDRNADGSLNVEANLTEETIQSELKAAIADPLIEDFSADLRDSYILVSAQRRRLSGDKTDSLGFRLDLGVNNGHLTAAISEAQINGMTIEEERLKLWNERIANRLARAGQRNPNSTLQTVAVTEDSVTMAWRVETGRSRSG